MGGFEESVEGFVQHPVTRTTIGRDGPSITQTTHPVLAAKLRRESSFLMAHSRIPYKITVPSPVVFTMNAYAPRVTDNVYPTWAALAHDLAHIVRD
jgi:methionine synthase II (cobalamin-independent)